MRAPKKWLPSERINVIRREAVGLLKKVHCQTAPVPIEQIARAIGLDIKYAPYNDGDLAGMLIRREVPIIAVNSAHHKNRQRFTIAHEIGHYILHSGDLHIDKRFEILRRDATSSLAVDEKEIEANQFAAEILMPKRFLLRELADNPIDLESDEDILRLSAKYAVSSQAMTYRIANIFM